MLKYLGFVQVGAIYARSSFKNLYVYAKDKSGPFKPGVETVAGTVKNVVRPVYHKSRDVSNEVLKFVDRKERLFYSFSLCLFLFKKKKSGLSNENWKFLYMVAG